MSDSYLMWLVDIKYYTFCVTKQPATVIVVKFEYKNTIDILTRKLKVSWKQIHMSYSHLVWLSEMKYCTFFMAKQFAIVVADDLVLFKMSGCHHPSSSARQIMNYLKSIPRLCGDGVTDLVYVENTTSSMHTLTCFMWWMTSCTSTLINNSQLSGDFTKIFCNVNKVKGQFTEWILKSSKDRTASLMDHIWLQINYKILHRTRSRHRGDGDLDQADWPEHSADSRDTRGLLYDKSILCSDNVFTFCTVSAVVGRDPWCPTDTEMFCGMPLGAVKSNAIYISKYINIIERHIQRCLNKLSVWTDTNGH